MTNTKDIILKLKEVREEKKLSFTDIEKLLEANNEHLSRSTISRIFADGSEETSFRYEETIRPIANALLDIDTIEETDDMDTQAMKSLLKYKAKYIQELEKQNEQLKSALDKEKVKQQEKIEKERDTYNRRVDFLLHQIELKDKRMDQLLDAVFQKDKQQKELLEKFMSCPCKKG